MECDATLDRDGVVEHDYHARLRASTASRRCSLEYGRVLSRRRFVPSVQETDLEH
jgi:hypothetical protein